MRQIDANLNNDTGLTRDVKLNSHISCLPNKRYTRKVKPDASKVPRGIDFAGFFKSPDMFAPAVIK